jgi:hypothetical protein
MSAKKINDKDVFENVVDIGLRMYGNGDRYPKNTVECITEYCRQKIRAYFIEHYRLIGNNRVLFLHTLIYRSRNKKTCLKRLQQFVQAKDRPSPQQDQLIDQINKEKKLTLNDRFNRICHQLQINLDDNHSESSTLDQQRSRQYARLDKYYNSDKLTPDDYLVFVEQQHSCFNNLRSLSSIDIQHWLNLNDLNVSNQDLRLAEICVFLIKEILLNLMDKVHNSSSIPCQINDILRREYVSNNRCLSYSGRKQRMN